MCSEEMVTKQILIDICKMFIHQLENDKCTAEEIRSISDSITENLKVDATVKDIADFYNQSEQNVRTVVSRNFHKEKPKRKVYYNFAWVSKIIPKSWRR
jgi:hypothetical protein